jgi:MFS family permease
MKNKAIYTAILVAALGYFVDIYDLLLFSIVRVSSLKSLGIPDTQILENGVYLINSQMAGLLIGGIFWGILGDKKGRLSVLFGSIFLYSTANILNAFVTSVPQYAAFRFLAGLGLAGELGAGVTLVCELMPKETRGYGTSIIACIGILGAVAAALVGDLFDWKTSYIIGGIMGYLLLALRFGVSESQMFSSMKHSQIASGNFLRLFQNWQTFTKYVRVILVGVPIWCTIGIIITFSPEFGSAFQMTQIPTAGKAVMYCYLGASIGDLASGLLSQYLKSRKKTFKIFLILLSGVFFLYFEISSISIFTYYFLCFLLGFSSGYWAIFVTSASEQFGTDIRSTVTTTSPNFVRAAVIPLTFVFSFLKPPFGIIPSAITVGSVCLILAFIALFGLEETFDKNLNYLESK